KLEVSVMGPPNAPDRAYLLISDTGIGMTPEQTSRVFDRYFSASTATTTAGRGLGMAMVKKIVERHHGDLSVASVAGQGTQVEINLPLARLAS
ncbi:sensor histidine kinase, partial [bacterium]|nr:sensor histidine kinase [bacterium]